MKTTKPGEIHGHEKGSRPQQMLPGQHEAAIFRAGNIACLTNIPEFGLAGLMSQAKTLRYVRNGILNTGKAQPDAILVIFFGKIHLENNALSKHNEIRIKEPQSGKGEIAFLTDHAMASSTLTFEKAAFAFVPKIEFKTWITTFPEIKLNFYK